MRSPLGPAFVNIFKVEFESTIVPSSRKYLSFWKQCVDTTFRFVNLLLRNVVKCSDTL